MTKQIENDRTDLGDIRASGGKNSVVNKLAFVSK